MIQILRSALFVLTLLPLGCAAQRSATFDTPEDAMDFLLDSADDRQAAELLLGPGGFELLSSGDEVADRQDFEAVVELMRERIAFEDVGEGRCIAVLGNDGWEFPIPLVDTDRGWQFDVEAGREEIVNRRVGRNELSTIESLRAMVEAQREYAAEPRDGNPRCYARRCLSSPGKQDGLYWPVSEGEPESPLGPLVAEAADEGYESGEGPIPYHGYFYRLITAQGPAAPGGARDYLDAHGRLTGGFGLVAWPATYRNSGVTTFLINHQGIVFQRDLGPDTHARVAAIRTYDPDMDWTPTSD